MNESTLKTWNGLRGKKYLLTLVVVYLAYLTHGIQAIVISQNSENLQALWGTNSAGISQAISYTGLAKFLTVWICGEISDKVGRKKMAAIGAALYAVSFIVLMTTHSYTLACVMAFLFGAATSFFDGSLYAAAQESWIASPGSSVILIKGFISVSGTIYPLLVASLRAAGGTAWKTGLILPAVMSVILLIVAIVAPYSYDEEMKAKKASGQAVQKKVKGALDADAQAAAARFKVPAPKWLVVPLALMGFINMSTMYSAQQFLTRYGKAYAGMSDLAASGLTSLYTIGSLAAVLIWAFAMAKLRWRTLKILMIDLCGSIIFYALAMLASSTIMIQVAAFAIGFFAAGGALQCGVTLIQEFHPGPKGRNLGIYYTFMGLSSYIMPVFASAMNRRYIATIVDGNDLSGVAQRVVDLVNNGTLTPQLVAEGLAARYCLMINLIFALLGLLFCLFLVMNYKKWFGQSAMAAKNPGETY